MSAAPKSCPPSCRCESPHRVPLMPNGFNKKALPLLQAPKEINKVQDWNWLVIGKHPYPRASDYYYSFYRVGFIVGDSPFSDLRFANCCVNHSTCKFNLSMNFENSFRSLCISLGNKPSLATFFASTSTNLR